ncbi:MAG: hypothetical protein ABIK28_23705, partial [Planctomycetota bacterium]
DPGSLKTAIAEVFAEVEENDSGSAGADAFELLAPIPSEVAFAMIKSLSAGGNDPIGRQGSVSPSQENRATRTSSLPSTTQPVPEEEGGVSFITMLVFFFIALFVLKAILHRRR